jgi:hypothetical protein
MSKKYQYEIIIKFKSQLTNIVAFTEDIPYYGSPTYKDNVTISSKGIILICKRSGKMELDDIFYNYNSSIYSQIIKTLVYSYALEFNCPAIKELKISRQLDANTKNKVSKSYSGNEISQPINNRINSNVIFNPQKIKEIFEETSKGKSLLIALSFWIKAMSSNDAISSFERLWKGFNSLYSYIQPTGTEKIKLRKIKQYIISNPDILIFSELAIADLDEESLRNSFRWKELIYNDFALLNPKDDFSEFIMRYSDERIMKLFEKILPYRRLDLIQKNKLTVVNSYLNTFLTAPVEANAELICLICLKYMYFVRNKSFHGEKIYGVYRLIRSNKETKEFEMLTKMLSNLIADIINSIDRIP